MVKTLDKEAKKEIVEAIRQAERLTSGEIRVHLQSRCKEDVLTHARKVFSRLGMGRTKQKNAVLIFVALDSRRFAVLGDSGIHACVGDEFWSGTRDIMDNYFSKGRIKEGIITGIRNIGEKLKAYFPLQTNDGNELSDTVTEG